MLKLENDFLNKSHCEFLICVENFLKSNFLSTTDSDQQEESLPPTLGLALLGLDEYCLNICRLTEC